jgi:hypothetical protein
MTGLFPSLYGFMFDVVLIGTFRLACGIVGG